jgi:glycosyltransferase involved in cell wall biosynthesis
MPDASAISVLMTVYNSRTYVAEAAESILAQSFRDFEFIIIDDGSTDDSLAILKTLAEKDQRIRLISRPNTGLARALNEGIDLAKGEFIARMDADDIATPDRFEKQIAYLRSHPDCVIVGSRAMNIDPYGMTLLPRDVKLTHEEIDAELMQGKGGAMIHPTVMMRRQAVLAAGKYRHEYNTLEDLDLFLRLSERGKLANLPETLLHYRQHLQSIVRTKQEEQNSKRRKLMEETYARRGKGKPDESTYNRPVPTRGVAQLREWAWFALKNGKLPIARKHARAALKMSPLSTDSWRLMYCCWRGR